jgi:hypothetical protein
MISSVQLIEQILSYSPFESAWQLPGAFKKKFQLISNKQKAVSG